MFSRSLAPILALAGLLDSGGAVAPKPEAPTESTAPVRREFAKDIAPILSSHCQPCHFAGGKVYDKMPFDKAETVHRLGDKLFTRIKDEKEQQTMREFLAQKRPDDR